MDIQDKQVAEDNSTDKSDHCAVANVAEVANASVAAAGHPEALPELHFLLVLAVEALAAALAMAVFDWPFVPLILLAKNSVLKAENSFQSLNSGKYTLRRLHWDVGDRYLVCRQHYLLYYAFPLQRVCHLRIIAGLLVVKSDRRTLWSRLALIYDLLFLARHRLGGSGGRRRSL